MAYDDVHIDTGCGSCRANDETMTLMMTTTMKSDAATTLSPTMTTTTIEDTSLVEMPHSAAVV